MGGFGVISGGGGGKLNNMGTNAQGPGLGLAPVQGLSSSQKSQRAHYAMSAEGQGLSAGLARSDRR